MGANTFEQTILIRGDVHKALTQAREEAREENGHRDGYSGDIQTCDDVTILHCDIPNHGTKAHGNWVDERIENLDKWQAEVYEVTSPAAVKRLKNRYGFKGKRNVRVFCIHGIGAN
jgi:hypothetical protein